MGRKNMNWLAEGVLAPRFFEKPQNMTKYAVIALCLVTLFVVPFQVANAQSSDIQSLLDRINRLEADLNNVQRKVFQGQDVPAPPVSTGNTPIVGGSEAAVLLSARLGALEEEQRRATGSAEENTFKIDQISSRLNKLVLDVDFRLTEIEHRLNGGVSVGENGEGAAGQLSSSTQSQNTGASGGAQGTNATNTPSTSSSETLNLPAGTQSLGTLRVPKGSDGVVSGVPPQTVNDVASAAKPEIDNSNPADQYNYAISLIREDDYAGAEKAFSNFLEGNQGHSLSGNAQYWLGETHYVRGDYPNAASAFLQGYQDYPNNSKAADNLLKLAMTLGRMDQKQEACATFQQMDKQFPKLRVRLKRISDSEKKKFECQ